MKIAVDVQSLVGVLSGVGYYTRGLMEGLARLAPPEKIVPYCFRGSVPPDLPAPVYARMAPVQGRLPARWLRWSWKTVGFPPVNWLLPGFDLFHFPDFIIRPTGGVPAVSTVYDLTFRRHPEFVEPRNRRYLERKLPASLLDSSRVIVISEFTRRELLACYPLAPGRVRVVPGGVDELFRKPVLADELARVRFRYGLPEKYVLTVGTLEPRKNLPGLLQAWKILAARPAVAGCKLVVAGMDGWLTGGLEEALADPALGRGVVRTGYVARLDLPALYRGARVLVFPSFYEGQGFPPLEAQAAGTPVAASRTGALPEMLGDSAAWFDPASPEEMAAVLERLLSDEGERERLVLAGTANSLRFTWEEAARKTLEVYREALGSKGGGDEG
ncbi:MAG TPA: glycosyltransferase family 1 protein [bacterium]|nr:glycosyltransferase family 1 protein [bacterium]HPQ66079.1 glycosyltransferase family 1 protein [bacterium]